MFCTRTSIVSGIHDWRLARPLDRLKHDFMIVDLKDCSSLQLAARVADCGCNQTSVNEMQDPYKKTTYSKVRLVDEGNHTRSNHEHCGDHHPSGRVTLSIHGPAQKH